VYPSSVTSIVLSDSGDDDVTLVHNTLASLGMDLKASIHPKAFR
jgi:hypothetical protein